MKKISILLIFYLLSIAAYSQEKIISEDPDSKFLVILKPNPNDYIRKSLGILFTEMEQSEITKVDQFAFEIEVEFANSNILNITLSQRGPEGHPKLSESVIKKMTDVFKKELNATIKVIGQNDSIPQTVKKIFFITPMNWEKKKGKRKRI